MTKKDCRICHDGQSEVLLGLLPESPMFKSVCWHLHPPLPPAQSEALSSPHPPFWLVLVSPGGCLSVPTSVYARYLRWGKINGWSGARAFDRSLIRASGIRDSSECFSSPQLMWMVICTPETDFLAFLKRVAFVYSKQSLRRCTDTICLIHPTWMQFRGQH